MLTVAVQVVVYVVPKLVDWSAAMDWIGLGSAENVLWFAANTISCSDICGAEAVLGDGPLLAFLGTWCGNGADAEGVEDSSVSGIIVMLCDP
jgi:hypothetical protein